MHRPQQLVMKITGSRTWMHHSLGPGPLRPTLWGRSDCTGKTYLEKRRRRVSSRAVGRRRR